MDEEIRIAGDAAPPKPFFEPQAIKPLRSVVEYRVKADLVDGCDPSFIPSLFPRSNVAEVISKVTTYVMDKVNGAPDTAPEKPPATAAAAPVPESPFVTLKRLCKARDFSSSRWFDAGKGAVRASYDRLLVRDSKARAKAIEVLIRIALAHRLALTVPPCGADEVPSTPVAYVRNVTDPVPVYSRVSASAAASYDYARDFDGVAPLPSIMPTGAALDALVLTIHTPQAYEALVRTTFDGLIGDAGRVPLSLLVASRTYKCDPDTGALLTTATAARVAQQGLPPSSLTWLQRIRRYALFMLRRRLQAGLRAAIPRREARLKAELEAALASRAFEAAVAQHRAQMEKDIEDERRRAAAAESDSKLAEVARASESAAEAAAAAVSAKLEEACLPIVLPAALLATLKWR